MSMRITLACILALILTLTVCALRCAHERMFPGTTFRLSVGLRPRRRGSKHRAQHRASRRHANAARAGLAGQRPIAGGSEPAPASEPSGASHRASDTGTLPLGSISSGTMRAYDLVPVFIAVLAVVDAKRALTYAKEYEALSDANDDTGESMPGVEAHELLDELFDVLNDYVPPYTHFGAHEGDGADFGVWVNDDAIDADIRAGIVRRFEGAEPDDIDIADALEANASYLFTEHGDGGLWERVGTSAEYQLVWQV